MNALLVAVSKPAVATSVYPVPTRETLTLGKVATPPATVAVVVPPSVALPGFEPRPTLTEPL